MPKRRVHSRSSGSAIVSQYQLNRSAVARASSPAGKTEATIAITSSEWVADSALYYGAPSPEMGEIVYADVVHGLRSEDCAIVAYRDTNNNRIWHNWVDQKMIDTMTIRIWFVQAFAYDIHCFVQRFS